MIKDWLFEEESGQGMVEYALILVLIAVAAITVMGTIGTDITQLFTDVSSELNKRP